MTMDKAHSILDLDAMSGNAWTGRHTSCSTVLVVFRAIRKSPSCKSATEDGGAMLTAIFNHAADGRGHG